MEIVKVGAIIIMKFICCYFKSILVHCTVHNVYVTSNDLFFFKYLPASPVLTLWMPEVHP